MVEQMQWNNYCYSLCNTSEAHNSALCVLVTMQAYFKLFLIYVYMSLRFLYDRQLILFLLVANI